MAPLIVLPIRTPPISRTEFNLGWYGVLVTPNSIDTAQLANGAVTTNEIADGTISTQDVDNLSASILSGGVFGAGIYSFAGRSITDLGTVDTADINGGTIDGVTIAGSDITVGAGKTLDVSAGTLTLADNQISGDKVEGGTIAAIGVIVWCDGCQ